jgi:hypothetical protein
MHTIGIDRKTVDLSINGEQFSIRFVSVFARKRAGDLFRAIDRITSGEEMTEEKAREAITAREECMVNLLESNGYTYDIDWWEKHTGYEDQNEFIYVCLMKDLDTKGGKKKA